MNKRMLVPVFILSAALAACSGNLGFQWVDLEEEAYQEGDLPKEAGSIGVGAVETEKEWEYLQWIKVQIVNAEAVTILDADVILFSDRKELLKAYASFAVAESQKGYTEYDPPKVGYEPVGRREDWSNGASAIYLSFQRCYAMVNIWARFEEGSTLTEEAVYQYAAALDDRLVHSVCPI